MNSALKIDAEKVMKRCQIGTTNYEDSNNLHAECYGTIGRLMLALEELEKENAEVYGLLGMAHLNLKQHLEYGFNPETARSTLISVGRRYPKLKAAMDEYKPQTYAAYWVDGKMKIGVVPEDILKKEGGS